jgi:RNAse (barnase) inhibitor barstar
MHPDDLAQPSRSCIHFVMEVQAQDILRDLPPGIRVAEINGASIRSDIDLLAEVARAFQLPDYFGMNWDALDECLRDLSWLPASGHLLVVSNARVLWANAYSAAGKLVEAWIFSADEWSKEGVPFHLMFC